MRITSRLLAVAAAAVPVAVLIPAVAMAAPAQNPAPPPPPTTPAYICDILVSVLPGVVATTNCEAFGGMQTTGYIPEGQSYTLVNRTGDIQKFKCSGGTVDAPTGVAPKKCTPLGPSVPASLAPPPVPYGGPGGVVRK